MFTHFDVTSSVNSLVSSTRTNLETEQLHGVFRFLGAISSYTSSFKYPQVLGWCYTRPTHLPTESISLT